MATVLFHKKVAGTLWTNKNSTELHFDGATGVILDVF